MRGYIPEEDFVSERSVLNSWRARFSNVSLSPRELFVSLRDLSSTSAGAPSLARANICPLVSIRAGSLRPQKPIPRIRQGQREQFSIYSRYFRAAGTQDTYRLALSLSLSLSGK